MPSVKPRWKNVRHRKYSEKVENHVVADITSAQEVKAASVDNVYPGDTTFNARYEIKADAFQIAQLESAMREYGIEYRRVQ